jgi:hypothetical protein
VFGSFRPTIMGDFAKAHWIHATVNNRQEEHQSTLLEMSGTIADQTLSNLIDPSATKSFISGAVIKIIKVKVLELLHTHLGFLFTKVFIFLLVIIIHYLVSYILGRIFHLENILFQFTL